MYATAYSLSLARRLTGSPEMNLHHELITPYSFETSYLVAKKLEVSESGQPYSYTQEVQLWSCSI